MDTIERSGSRTPLGDVTNTIGGGQNASNTRPQLIDPKECKRAREQARYASMSLEQRNAKAKKRRESRQRKKDGGPSQPHNVSEGIEESGDKYQPQIQDAKERKREREKARYAAISNEKKMEKNKKRREARKRKKDSGGILEPCSNISMNVGPGTIESSPEADIPTQTQPLVIDHDLKGLTDPTLEADATAHTQPSIVEDDADDDVIFEEEDEEVEGYLFAGQVRVKCTSMDKPHKHRGKEEEQGRMMALLKSLEDLRWRRCREKGNIDLQVAIQLSVELICNSGAGLY